MAKSYIHELGDRLSNGFTADNLPKHIKEIAPIMYNDGSNNFNSIQGALNGKAESSHTHGNIQNGGTLQTNDITIDNGDKLVVTDSSDSSKVARASIEFDGSTTTQALTKAGTWAKFNNYSHPAGSAPSKTGVPTANATPGFGGTFKVNQITTDATSHVSAVTERTITIPNATATTSADGLMSAADKTKLDGIEAGTASPLMDGEASVGNSLKYAREDHVHPSDANKLNVDGSNSTTEGVTAMMRKVPSGTADLNDESSYFGDSNSDHAKIVRRPVLDIWYYIKGKISSVLGLTETNYSGKAATAEKATADASGNNIENTYQKKLGASVDASGVVSFPSDVCANGSETLATIRYLQAYYSQFPKAGQGITINKDSDGAPIILVKQWKPEGAQLTCQRANPGDLASWRMKNMNFDNMGRMSMISDNYTYMPVPNDFGTAGQLLVSNGDGNAPKWKSGIVLPPIQKGFAYSGSGNSGKYAWICHVCKSSQSGASDTIHATFKIYTNTTGSGLSATADVWYRRENGKQGTLKGQLAWTHGTSPSSLTLHVNVYDDLSNNININLFAYMGATYQRVEASLENISSLNSPSTITPTNTSLLTDFYSNNFVTSLPTLGTNLELT